MMNSWLRCFVSIFRHKYYVWRGSRKIGGVPWHRMLAHDLYKLHPKEFFGYANKFYGDNDRPKQFEFAWIHHQNHCDHHWEYWANRSRHKKNTKEEYAYLVPMPWVCVREMVADWIGASIVYSGTTDMTDWLKNNLSKMLLHDITKAKVADVLFSLGYIDAVKWMG